MRIKSIIVGLLSVVLLVVLVNSCERIDAGPVGVKVNFGSFNYENYFGFLGSPNAKGYADLTIPGSGGIFAQLF